MRWNQEISDGVGSGDPGLEQIMAFSVVLIYLFCVFFLKHRREF